MITVGRLNEFKVEPLPISADEMVKEYSKFLKAKKFSSASTCIKAREVSDSKYRLEFTKSSCYIPEEIQTEFVAFIKKKYKISDKSTISYKAGVLQFHCEIMNESSDSPKLSDRTVATSPDKIKVGDYVKYVGTGAERGIESVVEIKDIKKSKIGAHTLYHFNSTSRFRIACKMGSTVEKYELNESVDMNESDDYSDFTKECQANPTYKKAAAICKKYGYEVARLCYVEVTKSGNKYVNFGIMQPYGRDDYRPEISYNRGRLTVQTKSYGYMEKDKFTEFVKAQLNAQKVLEELSKLDLTTLHPTYTND